MSETVKACFLFVTASTLICLPINIMRRTDPIFDFP